LSPDKFSRHHLGVGDALCICVENGLPYRPRFALEVNDPLIRPPNLRGRRSRELPCLLA
jgi:hypothetical protein